MNQLPEHLQKEQDDLIYNEIHNNNDKVFFANLIVGAPGSGKTSYCHAMKEFMTQLGREVVIINLDPANELLPTERGSAPNSPPDHLHTPASLNVNIIKHKVAFSITDMITVDDVMQEFELGPNGALLYCMEWIEDHLDEIYSRIMTILDEDHPNCRYILFDFPGQIELYTNAGSVQNILLKMTQKWRFRCAVVHLTDSLLCKDPSHYISSLMVSLTTMLHLQMPHVNVLTKVDLFAQDNNPLLMPLDAYDGVDHLKYLLKHVDEEYKYEDKKDKKAFAPKRNFYQGGYDLYMSSDDDDDDDDYSDDYSDEYSDECSDEDDDQDGEAKKKKDGPSKQVKKYLDNFRKINKAIVSLLDDYSLVQLTHLTINDKYLMNEVLTIVDKAVGYTFRDIDLSGMQFTNNAKNLLDNVQGMEQYQQNIQQRKK